MLVLVLALISKISAIFELGFLLIFNNYDNEVHFYQMT